MSEEEFEAMPGKIERYFDRVRELLADELAGAPEDYEPDEPDRRIE